MNLTPPIWKELCWSDLWPDAYVTYSQVMQFIDDVKSSKHQEVNSVAMATIAATAPGAIWDCKCKTLCNIVDVFKCDFCINAIDFPLGMKCVTRNYFSPKSLSTKLN